MAKNPTSKPELTTRQVSILDFIKTSTESQGYAPSMREIGEAAGLNSPASVKYQLDILEEKGFIRRDADRGRAMEVVLPEHLTGAGAHTDKTRFIPLVGSIAAGVPITADQQVEETFPLPESLVGKGDLFMLEIKGDSMIDASIVEGDLIVCRQQKTAENGDMVAAMIDGEATCKIFKQRDGHTWLLPRNSNYEPIPADNCEILGKVVTVLRKV